MSFNNNPGALSRSIHQERIKLPSGLTAIVHGLDLPPPFKTVVVAQNPINGEVVPLPWLLPEANQVKVRQSAVSLDVLITIIG